MSNVAALNKCNYIMLKTSTEAIFTDIFKKNGWCGTESISGTGSDSHQTRIIVNELPFLFRDLGVSTILDAPCGDFHWMQRVELNEIEYIGADIVNELIESNIKKYAKPRIRFQKLNLITDNLPKVDLIFTRDCLVHLSFKEIFEFLKNLCISQSEYFLTTTFTERNNNYDIPTGEWRTLNLQIAPFFLPPPIKIINERCTEDGGKYTDKSLGLWKIADIRKSLLLNTSRGSLCQQH